MCALSTTRGICFFRVNSMAQPADYQTGRAVIAREMKSVARKAQEVLAWRPQTKNAARGGSIYLVNLRGSNSNQYLDDLQRISRLRSFL
jgi:hypothetical protein